MCRNRTYIPRLFHVYFPDLGRCERHAGEGPRFVSRSPFLTHFPARLHRNQACARPRAQKSGLCTPARIKAACARPRVRKKRLMDERARRSISVSYRTDIRRIDDFHPIQWRSRAVSRVVPHRVVDSVASAHAKSGGRQLRQHKAARWFPPVNPSAS